MSKFEIDQNKISFDDQKTWDLISSGDTVGVFQLESRVGRRYAKMTRPRSLEELSDLVALIRPGCLQSRLEDDRSLTDHYVSRKQGDEEVSYAHPSLEPMLKTTMGIMTYQEQAISIGQKLAGMNQSESDLYLRYAIGKKKAALIEEGKEIFLTGCEKNGIPKKEAELIFSWIEGCARYSFNKSICPISLVQTPTGEKGLKDLQIGEEVLAPSKNGDKFVQVSGKYDHGLLECYEIELECGKKIKCTMDHKFLCKDNTIRPLYDILLYSHEIVTQNGVE